MPFLLKREFVGHSGQPTATRTARTIPAIAPILKPDDLPPVQGSGLGAGAGAETFDGGGGGAVGLLKSGY
jgi:hypothetical protein